MIAKTTGIYFDGESAIPQEIELIFDDEKSALIFETVNIQTYAWDIDLVSLEIKSKNCYFEYGCDPIQSIKIADSNFAKKIKNLKKAKGNLSWYHKLMDMGIKAHILFTFFIFAIIGLGYFYAVPWIAEKAVVIIPEEYDSYLGETFFEQNMLFIDIDTSKTKALNLFAKELNLKNTKKLKFTIVNSPIINAYALPDGNIVVFSGILNTMKDYDELVGLIGHEVAHVNHRHSMKMMCRNLSGYIFVSAILGDANAVMAIIGDNANSLQSLSFSRKFEHEADAEGFKIIVLNKTNPIGMSNLFKRLQDKEIIGIPDFLSSHPITMDRINYINKLIIKKPFEFKENAKLKKLFLEIKN
jgi:Zn-dependent protease with chaperone function